jgi:phage replication O-like protein O
LANPQTEDGHVEIANDLWEAIARQDLSGNEFRVLLGILRKLYGFKKKSDWISNRLLAKMTGVGYSQAGKMVIRLAQRQIITLDYLGKGQRRIVRFNKDYDKWTPLPKKAATKTLAKTSRQPLPKKANDPSRKRQTTKESTTKETLTKSWGIIFKKIEEKIGRKETASWLRPAVPLGLTDKTLTLGLPNDLYIGFIKEKYLPQLKKIAGREIRLVVS